MVQNDKISLSDVALKEEGERGCTDIKRGCTCIITLFKTFLFKHTVILTHTFSLLIQISNQIHLSSSLQTKHLKI